MTFDQLKAFIAVAEREHLTQAAAALGLTPSAVSASIRSLESFYKVQLFDRIGRGIELTRQGEAFLREAKATMARIRAAEDVLSELGGLRTGRLELSASQTISNYWLPPKLMHYARDFPGIVVEVATSNTAGVIRSVLERSAELGLIEGLVDEPALAAKVIARDNLVIVGVPDLLPAQSRTGPAVEALATLRWVVREPGSGTRAMFERALRGLSVEPDTLDVAMVLPSNEAVLSAVLTGNCVTAVSKVAAAPFIENGQLAVLDIALPPREFTLLRHKERSLSAAAREFYALCTLPQDAR
ncbi:LysR substrate-binding domain-containing protein [Rhizobium sp. Root482]|uniref:LysR substrate-binding domain-containing protein n=1 Tax=Rhizobium sp. Root482 TaxID=1736543 RepID=UPI0006F2F932|nr:LysR substrate-binding domain-containing protein [Rhizobium sp. Root482]KQY14058.1 LysR family transcriptional regulator [Rhizobium sp. Root482]